MGVIDLLGDESGLSMEERILLTINEVRRSGEEFDTMCVSYQNYDRVCRELGRYAEYTVVGYPSVMLHGFKISPDRYIGDTSVAFMKTEMTGLSAWLPKDDGSIFGVERNIAVVLLKEVYSAYADNIRSDVIMSSKWRDWTARVQKEMGWN